VAQYVGQARQQERDYGLAQQHQRVENAAFGVKAQTAVQARKDKQNEVITSGPFAGYTKQQVRDLSPEKKQKLRTKAKTPSSVVTGGAFAGYTQAEIRRMPQSQKDQLVAAFRKGKGKGGGGDTPAGRRAEKNRIEQVRLRSGKALGRLGTAQDIWESLKKSKITTGQKDDKGNDVTRPTTPSDIKAELLKRGYSADEIHLMLMIRAGKKFGPAEVAAAHRLGIRIPRKYLPSNKPATYGTQAAPDGSGGSRPT
jgi:hypothetical protein